MRIVVKNFSQQKFSAHCKECNLVSRESGFTIIEVMVVVVIMGILSALAIQSFKQEAFRNAVQGEAKQISTFLNSANMYVKKTADSAAIAFTDTGMYLMDSTNCAGDTIQSNEWDTRIVLSNQSATPSSAGLPTDTPIVPSTAFLGNWSSCVKLGPGIGNTITESGGVVITHSGLTGDESYEYAVLKEATHIGFRKFGRIGSSTWGSRK